MARPGRRQQGEGSVYRRADGRWVASASLGRKADGRRGRRDFYGATAEQAMARRRQFLKDLGEGYERPPGRSELTGDWLAYWLERVCAAGETTRVDHGYAIRTHLRPALGHIRLADLTEEAVEALYARMTRQGLSPLTVRRVHSVLRSALEAAVARRKIPRNPCAHVSLPALERSEITPPDAAEVRALLAALKGRRNAARWLAGLALGLRQGEALGMLWPCVDLEAGTLEVDWQLSRLPWRHGCDDPAACAAAVHARSKRPPRRPCPPRCAGHAAACPQRASGGLQLRRPKSRGSRAVLPIPAQLAAALRAHRAEQARARLAAGPAWRGWAHDCGRRMRPREIVCPACRKPADPGALVFTTAAGRPVDPRADDYREWRRLLEQAGLPRYRIHDARHFTATMLLELGVEISVVQTILRHSDVRITRAYQHVSAGLAADAVSRAADRLWQDLGT